MTNIEMILKLMEPELNKFQLAKLKNVLDTILRTNRISLPNEELLERFVQNKKLVGLKDTSLKGYVAECKQMENFLNKNFTEVTTADIKDYLSYTVQERHISATTLQTKIRILSSFFEFLVNDDFIEKNPTAKIERVMVEKKIKKAFSFEEMNMIRNACDNRRDRAFIEFLYSTGTRISEALALDVKDINFNEAEVIVFGKGHKERVVYLSDECMRTLQIYLESRYAQPDEPLFTHLENYHRLTVRAAELLLKDIGVKSGVDNVHPHRFRRTMATHLLDKGMPIEQIKEVLGHARLDTTMIYCNVNSGKIKESFKDAFNGYTEDDDYDFLIKKYNN